MGSKKVKCIAISVAKEATVPIAEPEKFKAAVKTFAKALLAHPTLAAELRGSIALEELENEGLLLEPLSDEVGKDLDPFDLICHIAFDRPPLTRRERAAHVKKRDVFTKYGPQARAVLEALLAKYQDEGLVGELDNVKMLEIPPFSAMGTPLQLIQPFGGKAGFEQAVHELQAALYQESA